MHGPAAYLSALMLLCAVLTRRDGRLCAIFTVLLIFFVLLGQI